MSEQKPKPPEVTEDLLDFLKWLYSKDLAKVGEQLSYGAEPVALTAARNLGHQDVIDTLERILKDQQRPARTVAASPGYFGPDDTL